MEGDGRGTGNGSEAKGEEWERKRSEEWERDVIGVV